jgi:hypothetical protein
MGGCNDLHAVSLHDTTSLIDDAHGKHACNCTYMYAFTCNVPRNVVNHVTW